MSRGLKTCLLSLLLTLSLAAPALAGEFSADMIITGGGQNMAGKIYMKGKKQRLEFGSGEARMINIMDLASGRNLALLPGQRMYMDVSQMGSMMGGGAPEPIERLDKVPADAKLVGTDTVQGYHCKVYQFKAPAGQEDKAWMAEELGFWIKNETTGPKGKVTMQLKNIKQGGVSDAIFAIPPGYKKMQLPNMGGGGMGGMGRK